MERVRTTLAVMPDPAIACDAAGTILDVNDEARTLLGYEPEELVGRQVEVLVPQGLVAVHERHRAAYAAGPRRRRMGTGLEIRALRKDGVEVPVDIALSPIPTREGLVVIAALRDVSEAKRTERLLRRSERRLAEAQRVARVGSWEWDVVANRVTWSEELFRIYGVDPESFDATYEAYLSKVLPEDRQVSAGTIAAALRSGSPFAFEERIVRPDGEIRWLATWGRVESGADGSPLSLTGICQDITERKEVDEMKDAFLTATSHELRTPLAGVLGIARTLLRRGQRMSPDERDQLQELLVRGAEKLDDLLADLLDLDRLTRGAVIPHRRPTDLAELVQGFVADMEADDHLIRVEVEAQPLVLDVDAPKVERILDNLLSNASRHTPPGSTVWVRLEPQGDGALLSVEDEGPGVPDDLKGEIFQPFRRGAVPEYRPGTGIGLSLVGRFAELHDGRAWVEDRPGGGAAFRVFLPAAPDEEPIAPRREAAS